MQSSERELKNGAPYSSLFTQHSALSTSARSGFTLTEMLVVIGIIILFVTLAIPAISSITGTRSISAAENQISAVLARAREEAIGIQDYRGVFFYLDPREDRVVAALVRPADLQNVSGIILLDTVANRDYLMLPQGIRLQTFYDGRSDRYLGFNPVTASGAPPASPRFGGVILFDGQGRLVSKVYGFQLQLPDPANPDNGIGTSDMSTLLVFPGTTLLPKTGDGNQLRSQMGLVLFDAAPFKSQNFTDGDPKLDSDPAVASNETNEEAWLDANSTPLLINRFNGTLIRGE